jgi:hypothetical protein
VHVGYPGPAYWGNESSPQRLSPCLQRPLRSFIDQ